MSVVSKKAEIFNHTGPGSVCRVVSRATAEGNLRRSSRCSALLLVVWTLKREVRAIRGCLGM